MSHELRDVLISDTTDVLQRQGINSASGGWVELSFWRNHRTGEQNYFVTVYDGDWVKISRDPYPSINLNTAISHYNRIVRERT